MKRLYQMLLGALLCFPLGVRAQEPMLFPRVKVNGGIKLGANLAKLNADSWDGNYKTNLLGGVFLRVHNGRWGVQAEGFFSQSEYITGKDFNSIYKDYVQAGKDSLSKGTFRVKYLNIPLMVQIKILSRVWMQVGAQYSGVVSMKDKDELLRDAGSLFQHGSFSGVGGLWIDLPLHLNIGARYVLGFSNVNEINEGTAKESWKQRNVQFHLGWSFF